MNGMRIARIELSHFRSYVAQTFHFGTTTVVVAPNGRGKTNLLEAIYLLSTGESLRAGLTEEMIAWGSDISQVTGIVFSTSANQLVSEPARQRASRSEISDDGEYTSLGVILTRGVYLGKRVQKRRYLVDGVSRTRATFAGRLPAVMFRPEDMRLVEGNPSRRRQYMDEVLSLAHPDYARAHTTYEASLRRRNRVLDAIREGTASRTQLSFWDQSLIKNGNVLTDYRRDYLEYLSGVTTTFGQYRLQYAASTISSVRLAEHAEAEVAVGHTLVGPHKDDFVIEQENKSKNEKAKNLMIYGSRGEQRLGVLFLKWGALRYMEDRAKVQPVLLLDDIFSELDREHRDEVVRMAAGRQTILTTAEEEVAPLFGSETDIIRL